MKEKEKLKQKDNILPRCYFCHSIPEKGIHGGWRFRQAFICDRCEQKIINTEVGSLYYQELMGKIRAILD